MTTIFTNNYMCEQAREEQRWAADAEHIANIKKAKSHIIIYAWQEGKVSPSFAVVFPHFVLGAEILSGVGLCHQDEQEVKFRLYNMTICTWTTVWIGHVITLRDGDQIFLKWANVIDCLNFDDLLSGSQGHKPHFSSHDHTYV
ncbi:hypothetical protein L208DRAFT_1342984 [Tricholoma matsutake]|nr:hypothetical protein L208DRAFT_1342984 [Tricholoma matsutake 945]